MASKSVAIIGAGPAGCMCAYFAAKNADEVVIFDFDKPLHTLLYTGGGRCNLAYAEYDPRELAKFYPRGEKFLYSLFSRFSTFDTIDFFSKIGVDTYVQDDLRIFPTSDSAKDVRENFLRQLNNCSFKREKVVEITKNENEFLIKTEKTSYHFDNLFIAIGGHSGFDLAKNFGHKIIEPKPALVGLITFNDFKPLKGVSLRKISAKVLFEGKEFAQVQDDLLFTDKGISGPLAYIISSVCARLDYCGKNPLSVVLNFASDSIDLQDMLNSNPKKDIKNLIAELVPKSLSEYILENNKINPNEKCCNINGKTRDLIMKSLSEFEINVISPSKEGEIVTSGGVCLDEINPKTMESKLVQGLYFCGEVIDIDGFCGGFNLQNCWSTGFVAGNALNS